MRHIISVLLENEPGALSRVVGLFSARGYNIETLTVAPTEDASLSRMTIVSVGSDDVIEQITKHLNRLIEVVKVVDLTEGDYIERELMLIKVRAVGKEREEMKRMADIFRGRIIDVTETHLHDRADRRLRQARRVHPGRRPRVDPRNGPHRQLAASVAASASCGSDTQSIATNTRGVSDEGLLRQGRRPLAGQGQEGDDRRLRLAGPRARAEPEGLGRQGDGRRCARAARPGRRPRRPASRSRRSPMR